ncbi:MAG: methionine biosynthesis protein MetW [Sulfurisoma sp.]|nr:methionine biosynthesis protein MetW [Sulfurisoma sp.]
MEDENKGKLTPNIRFFTIADFDALCDEMGIVVKSRMVLDEKGNTFA